MRLTRKQRKILNVLLDAHEKEKPPLDIDQLIEELPYKTTKQSLQFSLRALIGHGLIDKGKVTLRRGRNRRLLTPTERAITLLRSTARAEDAQFYQI